MAKKKKIIIIGSFLLFILLLLIYLSVSVFYQYHFFRGTYINGIDCSNKSVNGIYEMMEDQIRTYYLQITERNNLVEHITAEDINLTIDIEKTLDSLLAQQNSYFWIWEKGGNHTIGAVVSYDESALLSKFNLLKCLDVSEMTEPTAPTVKYSDGIYTIGAYDPGTKVDSEKLKEAIINAINNLDNELVIEDEGCYLYEPSVESESYSELLDTLNKYVSTEIVLTFDGELDDIVIDGDVISQWISVDENMEIVFDMDAVENYVSNISKDVETMGSSRKFVNSYGNQITVSGGDYGWWISESSEAKALVEDIKSGLNVTREMNYLQRAVTHGGENDFGNTYIEISLSSQHLFCYQDGELITDCDIISGSNATPTPAGIYRMRFMFTNYTFNRTYFNRTVSYWMVFYGNSVEENIGLISCDWRNDFGGTLYQTDGSHGSIYVPMDSAKIIYDRIPNDIPVIIYK